MAMCNGTRYGIMGCLPYFSLLEYSLVTYCPIGTVILFRSC